MVKNPSKWKNHCPSYLQNSMNRGEILIPLYDTGIVLPRMLLLRLILILRQSRDRSSAGFTRDNDIIVVFVYIIKAVVCFSPAPGSQTFGEVFTIDIFALGMVNYCVRGLLDS